MILYARLSGREYGLVHASNFVPSGASSGPPPSCWGLPSKIYEIELAGNAKSPQKRTFREQQCLSSRCAKVRKREQKVKSMRIWARKAAAAD